MKLLYLDLFEKKPNDQFEVTLSAQRIGLVDIVSRYIQVEGQVFYTFTWLWKNSDPPTMKELEVVITYNETKTEAPPLTIVSIHLSILNF